MFLEHELEELNSLNLEDKIYTVNECDQELENYICSANVKGSLPVLIIMSMSHGMKCFLIEIILLNFRE